jgi:dihydroxyacetone kinase-like protein
MKKLINDPDRVVEEALEGMALAHADLLEVHLSPHYVLRAGGPAAGKVGVVSGGGSGHEPLHGGFVGHGMLTAAVPGAVFTSPTPDPIQAATAAADGGAGVLHIVKNYTGDVLNFETAAELAAVDGIEVRSVVVDDDVAVKDSLYTAGRRGVGGTVLLEKIVGAAAERGDDLDACEAVARRVVAQVGSMGMALTSCTVPHAGRPTFDLADDEMEIGIGIHGEPGRQRLPVEPADQVARRLLDPVVEDLGLTSGSRVVVMTNGMGGTPQLELYIVHREVERLLAERGVQVERRLVGNYITSLEMQGASVTVLTVDDELLELWDAPVCTPALRWGM